ncbi:MAG: purine-nucleoside phosphorylase [Collinsella sp.]|nr:purine-nucleoside phosphorylase [Collinsella sp.]
MADEELVDFCAPSMEHPVAIVLGSGLGALADRVKVVRRIPYEDIDGFPHEALPVEGHRFEVLVGTIEGVPVVVYPGRVHLYQGYSALEVTSLVRHAHRLGCRDIILTCASGAVRDIEPGSFGLIADQINLTGHNPLATPEGAAHSLWETPFVPMAGAYSNYLSDLAREAAHEVGVNMAEGTYVGMLGPSYETDAEIHALGVLGADFVGCSTVCETIMAQALKMQVLGLTLVTNKAGRADNNHAEVLAAAEAAAEGTTGVLLALLRRLSG